MFKLPSYITWDIPYPLDKHLMNLFPKRIEKVVMGPTSSKITVRIK